MQTLSIIIPAFNEEEGIVDTVNLMKDTAVEKNWEIIVINDGSNDRTPALLSEIKGIRLLNHSYNKGYGASLKTGINNSNTDLVAFYDADGQHRPIDLLGLYNSLGSHDMIVGRREKDGHQDWMRKPGKWVLTTVANFLAGRRIPDLNSGLRVVKRDLISRIIPLMPDGFSFSSTSSIAMMNMGFSVGYYPIKTNKRIGKSTVKQLKHGSNTLLLILRLIVLFNPLKVFLPVSFFLIGTGVIYEIFWGIMLPEMKLVPGALLLILSGVIVFFFGLLADQISELRKQSLKEKSL